LNSLPNGIKIPLKKDGITALTPAQIVEHIDAKSNLGKEYFLQLAKSLQNNKSIKKSPGLDAIM
jgi:hypothetical protein